MTPEERPMTQEEIDAQQKENHRKAFLQQAVHLVNLDMGCVACGTQVLLAQSYTKDVEQWNRADMRCSPDVIATETGKPSEPFQLHKLRAR